MLFQKVFTRLVLLKIGNDKKILTICGEGVDVGCFSNVEGVVAGDGAAFVIGVGNEHSKCTLANADAGENIFAVLRHVGKRFSGGVGNLNKSCLNTAYLQYILMNEKYTPETAELDEEEKWFEDNAEGPL